MLYVTCSQGSKLYLLCECTYSFTRRTKAKVIFDWIIKVLAVILNPNIVLGLRFMSRIDSTSYQFFRVLQKFHNHPPPHLHLNDQQYNQEPGYCFKILLIKFGKIKFRLHRASSNHQLFCKLDQAHSSLYHTESF